MTLSTLLFLWGIILGMTALFDILLIMWAWFASDKSATPPPSRYDTY